MSVYLRVEGMNKLVKSLEELGKVPQKYVTSASRKAMTAVKNQSKEKASSSRAKNRTTRGRKSTV